MRRHQIFGQGQRAGLGIVPLPRLPVRVRWRAIVCACRGTKSLEILQGEPATYVNTADSGATRTRHFCPNCGTPLFAENSAYPDGISIKAGTLDDPSIYKVQAQFWTSSAPPWQPIDEKVPSFPKGPDS